MDAPRSRSRSDDGGKRERERVTATAGGLRGGLCELRVGAGRLRGMRDLAYVSASTGYMVHVSDRGGTRREETA
jgi:hypothetical protein